MGTLRGGGKCPHCGEFLATKPELDRHTKWVPLYEYRVGQRLTIGDIRGRRFERRGSHVVVYKVSGLNQWLTHVQITYLDQQAKELEHKHRAATT